MSLDNLPVEWLKSSFANLNDYRANNFNPLKNDETYYELYSVPIFPQGYPEILQANEIGSSKQIVEKNDVLLCKINPRINRVWQVSKYTDYLNIASSEWIVFRQCNVVPNFYRYYFQSLEFRNLLCANVSGVGGSLTRAQPKHVATYDLPVPPLAEQQEIVRQLDVMLAQVEQIKARLDAIPAILKKFRQSVLADAVSGKLTEEWRKSNPHTISIETIESCRLNKWWLEKQKDLLSKGKKVTEKDKAKYKPAYLPESNFYGAIPPEWSLCTIDHLFDVTKLAGFEFTKFVKYHDDYDIPVIKAENVGKNGFKETQFSKVEKTVVDALPRSSIFGNELLIVFVGAGTGQVGRVPNNRRYFLGPNVALVKPNLCDLINSEFFEYLLRSLSGQDSLLSFAKGAAQPSLSMDQIRHATIVVPPIEEQEVILASIKILFNKASQIESLVNIAQKRVNLLTQSILAKAFSGELTAEWREQHQELITGINSAESLLAKIQAEREASKPVKKTRAKKEA